MITVAQINGMAKNDNIAQFIGTVKECKGSRQARGMQVHNYILTDTMGQDIECGMFSHDARTIQPGTQLTLNSTPNKSGAMAGLSVNEYRGTRSITVFENAEVLINGVPQQQAPPQQQTPPQQPMQQQAPPQQQMPPQQQAPAQQPNQNGNLSIQEMATIWVKARNEYKTQLLASGVPPHEAEVAANEAPKLVAQYWFGKSPEKTSGL